MAIGFLRKMQDAAFSVSEGRPRDIETIIS